MHKYITSISFASSACPKQHSVICHCTLTPVLSSLISSPGPHFYSHTLTLAPDCFFPKPSVSLAVYFPSYYVGLIFFFFFARVGSTLLKLSGRPIYVWRSAYQRSWDEGFSWWHCKRASPCDLMCVRACVHARMYVYVCVHARACVYICTCVPALTWCHSTQPLFKPWFLPTTSRCQCMPPVTHPRGFLKGQVSVCFS